MSSVRYFLGRDFQPAAAAAAYFGELEEALIHGGIDPGMIKSDAQTTKQCKLLRSTSQLACLLFLLSEKARVSCLPHNTAPAQGETCLAFCGPFLSYATQSPHATAHNGHEHGNICV
jgi:hypothetical protein